MKTKIMIIGAGPYGISLAYELRRRNVPFVIAGHPFSLWFDHTIGSTSIRSDRHASEIYTVNNTFNLTKFIKRNYPGDSEEILQHRIPNRVFRSYLQDVLSQLPFPIERQKAVRVEKRGDEFHTTLEDGNRIISSAVVVATGIEPHRNLPDGLRQLSEDRMLHSWQVQHFENWRDKELLLIGAGQSAAECAAHLADHNRITWVMRKKPVFYSEPINLPRPVFTFFLRTSPYFYFLPQWLKSALGQKFVETTMTPDMERVVQSKNINVIYADANDLKLHNQPEGTVRSERLNISFDKVIAATGYRYRLDSLAFLSDELIRSIQVRNGIPVINFHFQTSVSHLYMIGGIVERHYGPAQRFLMGSRHATLKLGKVLSR